MGQAMVRLVRAPRLLLELAGDLRTSATARPVEDRHHALERLRTILGARASGYSILRFDGTRKTPTRVEQAQLTGLEPRERAILDGYFQRLDRGLDNPVARAIERGMESGRTTPMLWSREKVLPRRAWYRHPYVNEVLRPAGIDAWMSVACPVDASGSYAYLTLRRPWGDRPFSRMERRLFEHFFRATFPLWRDPDDRTGERCACRPSADAPSPDEPKPPEERWPADAARLPCRRRAILDHLLIGASEKEIARRVGRSIHTVHRHVTALYRTFDVSSRAELMARFIALTPKREPCDNPLRRP